MKKDPLVFLKHIQESIALIERYINGLSEEDFLKNEQVQDAVVHRLFIIGEAVRNLPEETKQLTTEVAWSKIIAMRNKIVHEYFGLDKRLIWGIVQQELPEFKEHIQKTLGRATQT